MADSNITKLALSGALKELLEEQSFEKISVSDICERCGMNRKSFAEYFGIPYRTMTDWERGERQMPEYLLRLMAYKVKVEMLSKEEKENKGETINE